MINDLKDLAALFALCRKKGVTEITVGDCHVKFGELKRKEKSSPAQASTERSFDELTEEERMFYSAEGASV